MVFRGRFPGNECDSATGNTHWFSQANKSPTDLLCEFNTKRRIPNMEEFSMLMAARCNIKWKVDIKLNSSNLEQKQHMPGFFNRSMKIPMKIINVKF